MTTTEATGQKRSRRFIRVFHEDFNRESPLHPFSRGEVACRFAAWIDLVAMASWRATDDLKRGQLETSETDLADRWHWEVERIRAFLGWLSDDNRIFVEELTGTDRLIVTILNYGDYNGPLPKKRRSKKKKDIRTDRSGPPLRVLNPKVLKELD